MWSTELLIPGGIKSMDQLTSVSERLVSIMRNYVSAERYFPLAFIVRHLETHSCEIGIDLRWVFLAMLNIGVSPTRLLELYDRLFKSRDPFWQTVGQPLHLLAVLHSLLSYLAENPSRIPSSDRRRFNLVCLDAVASYLIELQANSSDSSVRRLIAQFKAVQAQLERM